MKTDPSFRKHSREGSCLGFSCPWFCRAACRMRQLFVTENQSFLSINQHVHRPSTRTLRPLQDKTQPHALLIRASFSRRDPRSPEGACDAVLCAHPVWNDSPPLPQTAFGAPPLWGAAHGSLLCSVCYSALGQTVQKLLTGVSLLPGKTHSPAGATSSASCLPRAHSGAAVRWGPTNACGQSHSPL